MVCGSCGKYCDPNRSFCQNCGSSVFVEDARKGGPLAALAAAAAAARDDTVSEGSGLTRADVRARASKVLQQARTQRKTAAASTASSLGCLGSLIRLAIFIGIIWYGWGYLDRVPQVRAVKDAYQRGEITDLDSAVRVVMSVIENGVPATAPQRTPAPEPAAPPPGRDVAPAAGSSELPPGVYYPGGEVTPPRVLRQVRPVYTAAARSRRIEGNVVVKGIVQVDGTMSDITLVRSLDDRYGLDQEAIKALEQWRFEPGQRGGMPVPVMIQIGLGFSLRPPVSPGNQPR